MRSVSIYGFGSFFASGVSVPGDVDILIVHERVDPESIDLALRCKARLAASIPAAHLTILSEPEEREMDFIRRSKATFLKQLRADPETS